MDQAFIRGAAVTRFGKDAGGLLDLVESVTRSALVDADLSPGQIGHVYFGNGAAGLLQGQEMIRGQVLLKDTGLLGAPIINVENACASSSTAFFLAVNAVTSGAVGTALAIGAEELAVPDKSRTYASLASATDTQRRSNMQRLVTGVGLGQDSSAAELLTSSPLMDHYASNARAYLERTGATVEDIARIVVKSRQFGALNPNAQFRSSTTVEDVLAARMVSDPLRMPMCAPIGNGAAAVVVSRTGPPAGSGDRPVRVRAASLVSNDTTSDVTPAQRAGHEAVERAGVSPGDLDVVELHDAAASAELILMEELGLCPPEEASRLVREGVTGPGGRLPINPSGGLLSRGHPIGATGCAQIVELVDQLRGCAGQRQVDGARMGLAQNGGGVLGNDEATVAVSILEV